MARQCHGCYVSSRGRPFLLYQVAQSTSWNCSRLFWRCVHPFISPANFACVVCRGRFCGGVVQCDLVSRRPLLGSRTQTTDQAATPGCSRRLFLIYGVPVSRDALGATLFLAIAQVSGSCLLYGLTGSFLLIIRILYALAVAACLSASSLADLAQLK